MLFLHSICLIVVVLVPAVVRAADPLAALEIPNDGSKVSGIGVISGWKCEAEGAITIRFNDGDPIPTLYGFPRGDTATVCGGDDGNNGFVTYFNWSLLGDGEHTAKAYDKDELFAESKFTVTTTGEPFLVGASGECVIPDFPSPRESTTFEWNETTQHLEMIRVEDLPTVITTPQ